VIDLSKLTLALAGSFVTVGGLLALNVLPLTLSFAAGLPHLVANGPSAAVSVGSSVVITGDVMDASGTPLYQFRLGNQIVQRYSTNNRFILRNLDAGQHHVTIRSLGMGQDRLGKWSAFRSAGIDVIVGHPHLTAEGPTNAVAATGDATINAQVVDAFAQPYFQFVVNNKTVQAYSTKSSVALTNLAPGTYRVLVESLGPSQYHNGMFSSARQENLSFTVPTAASPTLTLARASVHTGAADTITATNVPSGAHVTWSVTSSNASTAAITDHGNPATFVGTAEGLYTVEATVDGGSATAQVLVYGEAAGVTLAPASSTVVAASTAMDAISAHVVDAMGNTVVNFNGAMNINAVTGVTYTQSGSTLKPVKGFISVRISHGLASFNVGGIATSGVSVAITSSALTSSNAQAITASPTYATTTIKSQS